MVKMFLFLISVVCAVMIEVGSILVMTSARPDAPLGFWVWFIGLCVLAPHYPFWIHGQVSREATPDHKPGP